VRGQQGAQVVAGGHGRLVGEDIAQVTTELVEDGLKRDRIGRRHLPAERRLALL
jgi:hypothetical protein